MRSQRDRPGLLLQFLLVAMMPVAVAAQTPDADWEIWVGESNADGTFLTERLLGSGGPDRGVMIMRPRAGGYMLTGQLGNAQDGTSVLLLIRLV